MSLAHEMAGIGAGGLERAVATLRAAGLRRTAARVAILRLLLASPRHLSVAEINERLGGDGVVIDPSTTWRNMLALVEVGLLHAVNGRGAPVYGAADHPHHHVLCRACGAVAELPAGRLAPAVREMEQVSGFQLSPGSLLATGVCPECA